MSVLLHHRGPLFPRCLQSERHHLLPACSTNYKVVPFSDKHKASTANFQHETVDQLTSSELSVNGLAAKTNLIRVIWAGLMGKGEI
jgi:hypothetical protein